MTRTPRPPTRTQIADLALLCDQLAAELRKPHAPTVLQALADAADASYPTTASGTSTTPHNQTDDEGRPVQPDTPTEAKALGDDPVARYAGLVLERVATQAKTVRVILAAFDQWNPTRSTAKCPRCDHPIDRRYNRCQRVIDGVQCGSSDRNIRMCSNPNCQRIMKPGEYLRAGRCDPCRKHWTAKGVERIPAEALALGRNVMEADPGVTGVGPDGG